MLLSIVASYAPPLRHRFTRTSPRVPTGAARASRARGRGAKRRSGQRHYSYFTIASCRCQASAARTSQSAHAGKASAERA